MGDRSNIKVIFENEKTVGFYTHWGGSELQNTLKDALIRGQDRWDDSSYLARIIFSEMIREDVLGETGFGIYPDGMNHEEEHETIYVNVPKKTVSIGQHTKTFEEFADVDY